MSLFSSFMRVASVAMGGAEAQHFPYVQGASISQPNNNSNNSAVCLWKMYEATHESTGEKATIFSFDKQTYSQTSTISLNQALNLCRNAIQKLKTLRHPYVLKYLDSIETPNSLMLATEPCTPFSYTYKPSINPTINHAISQSNNQSNNQSNTQAEQLTALGLYQIVSVISWLNNDCKLVHGALCNQSIYQAISGEYRLFGFEIAYKFGDSTNNQSINPSANPPINLATLTPQIRQMFLPPIYRSPELSKYQTTNQFVEGETNQSAIVPFHYLDAWSLGVLMFDLYSGGTLQSINQLTNRSILPEPLQDSYKKLLSQNPLFRLNPKILIDNPYFTGQSNNQSSNQSSPSKTGNSSNNQSSNQLIISLNFLNELAIKNGEDKETFFASFAKNCEKFPQSINQYKILPILLNALNIGSANSAFPNILAAVLKISQSLKNEEYEAMVLPVVIKLFAANDRLIRVNLLSNIELFASHLNEQSINQSIFTHVLTGFSDSQPILREVTVKSMPHFVSKLNSTNLQTLLGWLTKLQADPEPAIRTNTTYCIAKLASHFDADTREKVCVPAFSRALRDVNFAPARLAGLVSFTATSQFFGARNCARKILPQVIPLTVDDVKEVRESALKCVKIFMEKIEQFHADDGVEANPSFNQPNKQSINANDPVAAASTLLANVSSWAVSNFANKFGTIGQTGTPSNNQSNNQSTNQSTYASSSTPLSQSQSMQSPSNVSSARQSINSSPSNTQSINQSINQSNRSAVADDVINPVHSSHNQSIDATGWGEDFDLDELNNQSDDDFGMSALSTKKSNKQSNNQSNKQLPKPVKKEKKPTIISKPQDDDSDDGFDDQPNDAFDNWDTFQPSKPSNKPDTLSFDPLSSPVNQSNHQSINSLKKKTSILSPPPNYSVSQPMKPSVKPSVKPVVKSNGKKDDFADFFND